MVGKLPKGESLQQEILLKPEIMEEKKGEKDTEGKVRGLEEDGGS